MKKAILAVTVLFASAAQAGSLSFQTAQGEQSQRPAMSATAALDSKNQMALNIVDDTHSVCHITQSILPGVDLAQLATNVISGNVRIICQVDSSIVAADWKENRAVQVFILAVRKK